MRVAIDYTSALAQTAGVARYTRSLVNALVTQNHADDLLLWSARTSAANGRHSELPSTVTTLPLPERWLTIGWQRLRLPVPLDPFVGRFDLLHCPDFVAAPSRRPVVVTIHDLSFVKAPQFAHPNLVRYLSGAVPRAIRQASAVVAVSRSTANDIQDTYGVPAEKIAVIPNGVDPLFHPPGREVVEATLSQLGIRQPYFVIVGTIEPRKNHLGVLQAFELAHKRRSDLSIVIAGRPGWLSEPILESIAAMSQRLPVRLMSNLADIHLPALFAGSLALIYPSWYEGFGLPVAEAMACGTAVITSQSGALQETAGEAAVLVDPSNIEAMAAAMIQLYDDPVLRSSLAERGTEQVRTLTWDRSAESHWALYRKVAFG